ncbi:MAG: undecaprenyl/decaprenyl-phosphate alpha-N-acetylglucosaminyl 1-phosphate transferase [Oscillospiraceae bacterium]|nr:undecaprenyl/decaprenyl-phosphate alpha-N-acetylglucosaminyl 1-phosphate transferase [Oscillospiraceae bacterium]
MLSAYPLWLRAPLSLFAAGALCHLFTPPVRQLALRLGAVDRPGGRRVNRRPVPRMGGLALSAAFLAAAPLFCAADGPLLGLLCGALLIAALGAADDLLDLRPGLKLLGQLAAAAPALKGGIVLRSVSLPSGESLALPPALAAGLTLLWLVACTNAVNLIDGLDGLAVGVSALGSLSMLLVALSLSAPAVAVLLAALTGACLGFLPYNRSPAQIFMGDAGSQFLGFALGALSVMGLLKFHALVSFFVPLLALSVPLADTLFAVLRRLRRGQSPFRADRGHIHHRLLDLGLSQKQAVAVLYGASSLQGLTAVLLAGTDALSRALCLLPALALGLAVWLCALRGGEG